MTRSLAVGDTRFELVSRVGSLVLARVDIGGGRYRIRTRVTGLEGRHDIQTTPIARLIPEAPLR